MAQAKAGPALDLGERLVVLAGGVLAGLALVAINSVLPSIEKALARGPSDAMLVKQLVGAVSLAMVVGAPLGGYLVDRIGMRPLILAATLLYALAGTAGLYLSSLPALLASRLVLGAAAATIQVTSLTLINTRLQGNERARWMGLHVAIATLSTLVLLPAAGVLGNLGWRWPFLLYLLVLPLFAALLPGRRGGAAKSPAAKATGTPPAGGGVMLGWFPWHYLLLSLLVGAITFMPTVYLPYQLSQEAQLSPVGIAGVLTVGSVLGAATAFVYGQARRRISTHGAFLVSFALAGLGTMVVAGANNLPLIVLGVAIYSIGNGWFVPNVMTALGAKVAPQRQARAAGLVKAAHFLSTPLCVLLVEPFARAQGAATVMLITSGLSFAMFVVMLVRTTLRGKAGTALAAATGSAAD